MLRGLVAHLSLALLASASSLSGQSVEVDLRLGYELPTGDLGELEGGGVATGATLGFPLSNSVVVGGRIDMAFLQGKGRATIWEGPQQWLDLTAVHYVAEVRLRPAVLPGWNLEVGVGAGASTLSFGDDGTATYPAVSGGLGGGVGLSENVLLIVGANTYLVFADSEDFDDLNRFGDTWFVGLTTGIRIKI